MCTLSFVTDVHLSFVTYLPMHRDRIETRTFRQGCHRQARGTTHRTTYETNTSFLSHPNMGNIRAVINSVSLDESVSSASGRTFFRDDFLANPLQTESTVLCHSLRDCATEHRLNSLRVARSG